jgi:hypothetical protein
MTTFTKSIFAVELDGRPYAIALSVENMNELLVIAAKMSIGGALDLRPVPNEALFTMAMTKSDRRLTVERSDIL